jgi:transcriptional regulator with XRE-family HTH domain
MKNLCEKFGERVRELRVARQLSQEKLAELADLHRTYIGDIERGERNVSLENIGKIAKALKINLDDLFKGL